MSGQYLWLLIPIAPLLAGLILFSKRERFFSWLWLSCVPALIAVVAQPAPLSLVSLWPGAGWGGDDLVTRVWLGLTAFVWGCATAFAVPKLHRDSRQRRFWVFWLLSLSGSLLLVIAQDALSFYVGFSMMSLAAYGLVVHLGGPQPRRAGRLYLQMALTGEFILLAALLMRVDAVGGSLRFEDWQEIPLHGITLVLFVIGLGIKIGFWPLHVWLPLAHPAAPSPASAVLSGVMVKAGVLGLWRCLPVGDPLLHEWAWALLATGLISAIYGILLGLQSTQAKTALAYSSVSQMGYFLVIFALLWRHPSELPALTVLLAMFALHHGVAKGALFLSAGVVTTAGPRRPWALFGYWLLMALPALALAGLPFTTGAAAKGSLKTIFSHSDFADWLWLLKLASVGTALLLLRALLLLWDKQRSVQEPSSLSAIVPWALLCAAPLISPWLWVSAREALLHTFTPSTLWTLLWPILLALLIGAVAIKRQQRVPEQLTRLSNPALKLSLKLKRLIQRPPLPPLQPRLSRSRWRKRERTWNRLCQNETVTLSAWTLCLLLLLGWLW